MPTNVIVNGDFSASTNTSVAGWTGTDIETRNSDVYIANTGAAQGRVVELNGGSGNTSVIEQSFTLDDPSVAELNFEFALRSGATANVDGIRFEILDASGNVLVTNDLFPTANAYIESSTSVTFPAAGTYTIRFTELGDNVDGRGALLDNVELLICFAGGTAISTPSGPVAAGALKVGQLVLTENGPKPIRWIGRRQVRPSDIVRDTRFCPVRIVAGALGNGLPTRDLLVSRQHRLKVSSPIVERMLGTRDALISAIRLAGLPGIFIDESVQAFEYVHILLDDHEVIWAEGAPSETLLLGPQSYAALSESALAEIDLIFPDLQLGDVEMCPAYLLPAQNKQRKLAERIARNKGRSLIETPQPIQNT